MGAAIRQEGEELDCAAPLGLHGAQFHLHFPSVGATETLMMAAAAAAATRCSPALRGSRRWWIWQTF